MLSSSIILFGNQGHSVMFPGINRKVKYRLKERSDTFSLDEVNGIISLIQSVDREITPQYSLAVEAYDQVGGDQLLSLNIDLIG